MNRARAQVVSVVVQQARPLAKRMLQMRFRQMQSSPLREHWPTRQGLVGICCGPGLGPLKQMPVVFVLQTLMPRGPRVSLPWGTSPSA